MAIFLLWLGIVAFAAFLEAASYEPADWTWVVTVAVVSGAAMLWAASR